MEKTDSNYNQATQSFMLGDPFEDEEYVKSKVSNGVDVKGQEKKAQESLEKGNYDDATKSGSLFQTTLKPKNKFALRQLLERQYDVKLIDTSLITDMSMLFSGIEYDKDKTIDLSNWNVSNVENMCLMFYNSNIDLKKAGIESWDVSKVRNMRWIMNKEYEDVVKQWNFHNEVDESDRYYKNEDI